MSDVQRIDDEFDNVWLRIQWDGWSRALGFLSYLVWEGSLEFVALGFTVINMLLAA